MDSIFFVKYTYDDQTAVNMLNYVTAAQEQAIDEYLRKTERRRREKVINNNRGVRRFEIWISLKLVEKK